MVNNIGNLLSLLGEAARINTPLGQAVENRRLRAIQNQQLQQRQAQAAAMQQAIQGLSQSQGAAQLTAGGIAPSQALGASQGIAQTPNLGALQAFALQAAGSPDTATRAQANQLLDIVEQQRQIEADIAAEQRAPSVAGRVEAAKGAAKSTQKFIDDVSTNATNAVEILNKTSIISDALIAPGGVFTGPFAEQRSFLTQVAGLLGADVNEERIKNTNDVIRNLQSLSLNEASKLKGSLSNKELSVIQKATGSIDDTDESIRNAVAHLRAAAIRAGQIDEIVQNSRPSEAKRNVREFRKANPIEDLIAQQETLLQNVAPTDDQRQKDFQRLQELRRKAGQ